MAMAAAGATIALAVSGCGSDDDESSGLSRKELVEQASPICKRHFERISAGQRQLVAGGQLPKPRQLGEFAQKTVIPEYKAQIEELRALKPSDDVAGPYRKWLADSDAIRAKVEQNPTLMTNPANFRAVNREGDKLGQSQDCHIGPG